MDSKALAYYIGSSTNENDRYKATSGGIGIAITKYLLSLPDYKTALTFFFDKEKCEYVPRLIYSIEDINNCGSIYQDIDVPRFIQKNINSIKGGVVVSCVPCQTVVVRKILKKHNVKCFIISFSCSGQTTKEGTWKYYEILNIERSQILKMQYRGNGWPSGVQIQLKNGVVVYKPNYTEPWVTIKQSKLFTPRRCYLCKNHIGKNADVSLSDPWLKRFLDNDTIGNTFFIPYTLDGYHIIEAMKDRGLICVESSSYDEFYTSQSNNLNKKSESFDGHFIKCQFALLSKKWYYNWAIKNLKTMKKHIFLLRLLNKFCYVYNKIKS